MGCTHTHTYTLAGGINCDETLISLLFISQPLDSFTTHEQGPTRDPARDPARDPEVEVGAEPPGRMTKSGGIAVRLGGWGSPKERFTVLCLLNLPSPINAPV